MFEMEGYSTIVAKPMRIGMGKTVRLNTKYNEYELRRESDPNRRRVPHAKRNVKALAAKEQDAQCED